MFYKLTHKYKPKIVCYANEQELQQMAKFGFLSKYNRQEVKEPEYMQAVKPKSLKKAVVIMPNLVKDVIEEVEGEKDVKVTIKKEV